MSHSVMQPTRGYKWRRQTKERNERNDVCKMPLGGFEGRNHPQQEQRTEQGL